MEITKQIGIVLCLFSVILGAIGADTVKEYQNSLTGKIQFTDWSEQVNGLKFRLGANNSTFTLGNRTPIIVLQVQNVSSKPIAINDLLLPNMLVLIKPNNQTYYGYDFQWIYDESYKTLPAGANVEAACRIPTKLMPLSGEYELSLSINRGIYPPDSHGLPLRGKDWWTGIINMHPLKITMK